MQAPGATCPGSVYPEAAEAATAATGREIIMLRTEKRRLFFLRSLYFMKKSTFPLVFDLQDSCYRYNEYVTIQKDGHFHFIREH